MSRKKPYLYKRVIAYIIDVIIVTLLSGILTVVLTDTTKYDNTNKEVLEITNKMLEDKEHIEEYTAKLRELNYELTINSVNVTIITVCISVIYYVVMLYFCHGITLGKYFMKIKVVSANDKELSIFNYFLRSLIINSILSNITTVILVYSLSKNDFINIYDKIGNIFTILLIISFIFMMYREDGRGLHDLLGNTKVVDFNNEDKNEIQDAEVVDEKKTKKKVGK